MCHEQGRGGEYNPEGMKTLDSSAVRGSVTRPWRLTIRELRAIPRREKLSSLHAHVGKFSKALIEGGDWSVFGRRGRRDQAVSEMIVRFSIAIQRVEMNRLLANPNLRAGDEGGERRSNIPVKNPSGKPRRLELRLMVGFDVPTALVC